MYQLYKSLSETVPYASGSPEPLTLCPCPPETLDCAAKCELSKVDGGIFDADIEQGASGYFKQICEDCGSKALFHTGYGFIFCEGCASANNVLRCPDCKGVWIMGEYVCRHCGLESDIPF